MEAVAGVCHVALVGFAERIGSQNSISLTVVLWGLAKLWTVPSELPTQTQVLSTPV